jgi:hypothetical protein
MEPSTASTPTVELPEAAAVQALDIPRDTYLVRAEHGHRETVITLYDLSKASTVGNAVAPAWSDPLAVIEMGRLGPLVDATTNILHGVFGAAASLRPEIVRDPESPVPSLALVLVVPRAMRHLRSEFFDRYARETVIPEGAPVPVLSWEYLDAVPA